jgi:hypothetical protein
MNVDFKDASYIIFNRAAYETHASRTKNRASMANPIPHKIFFPHPKQYSPFCLLGKNISQFMQVKAERRQQFFFGSFLRINAQATMQVQHE